LFGGLQSVWSTQDGKLPGFSGRVVEMPPHLRIGGSTDIWGCMDPEALNYNPEATQPSWDYPCVYPHLTVVVDPYELNEENENINITVGSEGESFGFQIFAHADTKWTIYLAPAGVGAYFEPNNHGGSGDLKDGLLVIGPNFGTVRTFEFSVVLEVQKQLKRKVIITQYGSKDIWGCMDPKAKNYNPNATVTSPNFRCEYESINHVVFGCMDPNALNYNKEANSKSPNYPCVYDFVVWGCTDPFADNFDEKANANDQSCFYQKINDKVYGCMDKSALNYDPVANVNTPDRCIYHSIDECAGCTDLKAVNYNPTFKFYSKGSCLYAHYTNTFHAIIPQYFFVDTIVGTFTQENCNLITAIHNLGIPIQSVTIKKVERSYNGYILVTWEISMEDGTIFGTTAEYAIPYSLLEGKDVQFYISIICNIPNMFKASYLDYAFTFSGLFKVTTLGISPTDMDSNHWVAYPNPTYGEIEIKNCNSVIEKMELFDLMGRKHPISINPSQSAIQIDISHLSAGIYLLRSTDADGNVQSARVVKK